MLQNTIIIVIIIIIIISSSSIIIIISSSSECDTDHYLVVVKVRERLAVSKQAAQNFGRERFNLRKLNELTFPF
jgi:hypothetical protein